MMSLPLPALEKAWECREECLLEWKIISIKSYKLSFLLQIMGKDVKNAYFGLIILIFIFGTILLLILKQGEFTITGKFIANTETVDSINSVGDYSSIALDSNGYAHISYRNASGLDLKYCNNTQGSWSCATLESAGIFGGDSSIAIDSNNKVHICNRDATNNDLRYCNNTQGSWSCAAAES